MLDEAASWLFAQGIRQWPSRFETEWIEPDVGAGDTWLIHLGDDPAGTVTVTDTDPLWDDDTGDEAVYVRRLAVRRGRAGIGAAILNWVNERAQRRQAKMIRLDCGASNRDLRSYYERAGFEHRGDREVGGPPGSRDNVATDKTMISLYERPVGGPAPPPDSGDVYRVIDIAPIEKLDRVMAAAWPPAVSEDHDGWQFRYTQGVTRRANSVLASGSPTDLDAVIDRAESFYEERGATAQLHVSDAIVPPETRRALSTAGYQPQATTWLLKGSAAAVTAILPRNDRWRIAVSDEPTDDWFDTYWEVESPRHSPGAEHIMRTRLLVPNLLVRFVIAYDQNKPLAVGQAVVDDGWGCLQCLATSHSGRRRGAAIQVFRALANATLEAGAPDLFAAVMADNRASLSLCRRAGLRPSHRYRYFARRD